MATFNTAHHESGGVVLFSGELILLFCENVNLSVVERNQSETGKLYLTTHRMIFTNRSIKDNLKSLSIPFYTMHDLSLEQPIFGANYIKGKATEDGNAGKITFKLKFTSGGATEYGQALLNAAKAIRNVTQSSGFQPPPPYTNPASQYYQAPPNVYQPAYNCGFTLPNDIFNQPPPAGFIYTSEAPPPYPGLNSKDNVMPTKSGYPGSTSPYGTSYPNQQLPQQQGVYPGQSVGFVPPGYPGAVGSQPGGNPPSMGFVGFGGPIQHGGGYPSQPTYAPQSPPAYSDPPNGYPSNHYPGVPITNEQNQQSVYPNLSDLRPSAPPPPQ